MTAGHEQVIILKDHPVWQRKSEISLFFNLLITLTAKIKSMFRA